MRTFADVKFPSLRSRDIVKANGRILVQPRLAFCAVSAMLVSSAAEFGDGAEPRVRAAKFAGRMSQYLPGERINVPILLDAFSNGAWHKSCT